MSQSSSSTVTGRVRIGGFSAFWGDTPGAANQLVEKGNVQYLVGDYLAEVTMCILAKVKAQMAKLRSAKKGGAGEGGFVADFLKQVWVPLMKPMLDQKIKIVTNAGGLNPDALRASIEDSCRKAGVRVPSIAVVLGDDMMQPVSNDATVKANLNASSSQQSDAKTATPTIIDLLIERNEVTPFSPAPGEVEKLWTEAGAGSRVKLMSCNAYLGAKPIAEALRQGAEIVITGRVVDSALILGPLMHEFGWGNQDYDLLSAGSLAGHVIECGAQCTGGNFTDWQASCEGGAGWANMGFPIAEVMSDGSFIITKPPETGGIVTCGTVAEQIVYEIHDPSSYALPDVTCDWTQVSLEELPLSANGTPQVLVRGAKGKAPSPFYKLGATSERGFSVSGLLLVVGFDAKDKAFSVANALIERVNQQVLKLALAKAGSSSIPQTKALNSSNVRVEPIGSECTYGSFANLTGSRTREVLLRITAHHASKLPLELLSAEVASAATGMAPGLSGLPGVAGRPKPSPVIRYHSGLIPKRVLPWTYRVFEGVTAGASTPSQVKSEKTFSEIEPGFTDSNSEQSYIANSASFQKAKSDEVIKQMDRKIRESVTHSKVSGSLGKSKIVPLIALALGRSGDKGDVCNAGIIAREEQYLPYIAEQVTASSVKSYMAHLIKGSVIRYPLPSLNAFNFVCTKSLDGGGSSSIALDGQGKAFAQKLLAMPIRVPQDLVDAIRQLGPNVARSRQIDFYAEELGSPSLKWLEGTSKLESLGRSHL